MAALRHGIATVIIPKDNERDLAEIDQTVRRQLNFIATSQIDTVLDVALNHQQKACPTILSEIPAEVGNQHRKPSIRQ